MTDTNNKLLIAAINLIDDVRRRYPGEKLRCPYMIALDAAVSEARANPPSANKESGT